MTANYIVRLPYEIYYFSRNLEHVLHDNSENLDDDQKETLAFETADYYSNHPDQFLESLYDEYFHVSGTYGEIWKFRWSRRMKLS